MREIVIRALDGERLLAWSTCRDTVSEVEHAADVPLTWAAWVTTFTGGGL